MPTRSFRRSARFADNDLTDARECDMVTLLRAYPYPCPPSIILHCPQKMIVEKGKENCFDAVKNSDAEQRYKTPCFAVSAKGTKTHLSSISLSDSFPHDMAKSPVTSGFFVFWRSEKRMDPHAKKAAGNRKRTRKRDRKTQTDRYRKRTIRHGM